MVLDLLQSGFILFFLALVGYTIGDFYDQAYRGRTYKPKTGDIDRILHYCSKGLTITILFSLLILLLFSYYGLIPLFASIFFPEISPQLLITSVYAYLLLLFLLEFLMLLGLPSGRLMRLLRKKFIQMEIIIQTDDNTVPIIASEIYDENDDFFLYIDQNGDWGAIKKSHVSSIKSERKKLEGSVNKFIESSDKYSKELLDLTCAIYTFIIIVVALPIYEKILKLFKVSPIAEIIWLIIGVVLIALFMIRFQKIYKK